MNESELLSTFEGERGRLWQLAYRMLGIAADADEVVQDGWLRWQTANHQEINSPAAWLTTVTTRLALDRLRSAQRQREAYVGPWLPEPVGTDELLSSFARSGSEASKLSPVASVSSTVEREQDPLEATLFAESLSLGFMALLERLNPTERAVFLLHDVFGLPFSEVAEAVGRTTVSARQIAVRARGHIEAGRPRFSPDPSDVEELAEAFLLAAGSGDRIKLEAMLDDDAVLISDGGANARAARKPIVGPMRIARFFTGLAKRVTDDFAFHPVTTNGQAGIYMTLNGLPDSIMTITWQSEPGTEGATGYRAAHIYVVRNPDKLQRFAANWTGD